MQRDTNYNNGRVRPRRNAFSVMAVFMGLVSLLLSVTGIFPIFFGSMAVIFALLSRGGSERMDKGAKAGLVTGLLGIIVGISLTVFTIYRLFTDPVAMAEFQQSYEQVFQSVYGISSEEYEKMLQEYYDTGTMPGQGGILGGQL